MAILNVSGRLLTARRLKSIMRIELNLNEEYTDKIRKLMEKNGFIHVDTFVIALIAQAYRHEIVESLEK